jgi:hypothetical protein
MSFDKLVKDKTPISSVMLKMVSEPAREQSFWYTRSKCTKPNKKTAQYIQSVKEQLPDLIYANVCKKKNLLIGSGQDSWSKIDKNTALLKDKSKDERSEYWLLNSYAEVHLPNHLNISFLNTSLTSPLALAWYSVNSPATVYLELASKMPKSRQKRQGHDGTPFTFSFMARVPVSCAQTITFKIINCMPMFDSFYVNVRENCGEWIKNIKGKVRPPAESHLSIDPQLRYRAQNWKVVEWQWTPPETMEYDDFCDVEFTLTPRYDASYLGTDLQSWNQLCGLQPQILNHALKGVQPRYVVLNEGKSCKLSQLQDKQIIVLNFWEHLSDSSILYFLRGAMASLLDSSTENFKFAKENLAFLAVLPPFPDVLGPQESNKIIGGLIKKIKDSNRMLAFIGVKANYRGNKQHLFVEKEVASESSLKDQSLISNFKGLIQYLDTYSIMFSAADSR